MKKMWLFIQTEPLYGIDQSLQRWLKGLQVALYTDSKRRDVLTDYVRHATYFLPPKLFIQLKKRWLVR